MPKVGRIFALVCWFTLLGGGRAEAEATLPGDGPSALPSAVRVGVVDTEQHRLTLATSVGYGYTEGVLGGDDRHHRVPMTLSLSYRPLSWLALGFTQDMRYDRHGGPPDDGDSGWIFEPRIRLRGGYCFDNGFRLGAEVMAWLPASDSQSSPAAGASVDMTLLASFAPERWPFVLAAHAGFRLDRSAEGSTNADALSLSDRLSLGVSQSHAVLLGLGLVWRLGPVELIGEWTWDVLVGEEAPEIAQTPMRLSAGARFWPIDMLQLWLLVDATPMNRPLVANGQPLAPIDPRVTVTIGASVRIGFHREPEEPEVVAPVDLTGQVVTAEDEGIAAAVITVTGSEGERREVTDELGAFEVTAPGFGMLELTVTAPGYLEHTETVDVGDGSQTQEALRISLVPSRGGLRGQVVSSRGSPLRGAQVRIVAGELTEELETDDEGRFELLDLEVGEVEITAEIYAYNETTLQSRVEGGRIVEVTMDLERAFPAGQVSGVVRAISGTPLQGTLEIQPLEMERTTTAEGEFEFDIPPGRYRIVFRAEGYTTQRRTIVVEENGVTVLNIDLRPASRRRRR